MPLHVSIYLYQAAQSFMLIVDGNFTLKQALELPSQLGELIAVLDGLEHTGYSAIY